MEHRRRLGDLLLENRLINLVQLRTALLAQQRAGIKLGEVLTQMGYVSEEDLLAVLGRQLGVPFGSIDYRSVDPIWLQKLPRETADALLVLPLHVSNGVLEVACADAAVPGIKNQLEQLLGCPVSLRLASRSDLRLAISNAYLSRESQAGSLLGELLLEAHVITQIDLDHVLEVQKVSGRKLGEILQDLGLISPEMLAEALQKQELAQSLSRA